MQERRACDPKTCYRLIVTPNHPFWVKGVGWTSVDRLNDLALSPSLGRNWIKLELFDGDSVAFSMAGPMKKTVKENIGWAQIVDAGGELCDTGVLVDLTKGGISAELGVLPGNIPSRSYDYFSIDDNFGIEWWERESAYKCTVYNLEIEGFHTYYVGTLGIWVHNQNCVTYYEASVAPIPLS